MRAQKPGNAVLQRGENDLRDWYVIGFIVLVSSLVMVTLARSRSLKELCGCHDQLLRRS